MGDGKKRKEKGGECHERRTYMISRAIFSIPLHLTFNVSFC